MAIKIIKKPKTEFTMECEKCECVFSYSIHDLQPDGYSNCVTCPCCSTFCSHLNRKKSTEGGEWKV